jgi:hypothetical protein
MLEAATNESMKKYTNVSSQGSDVSWGASSDESAEYDSDTSDVQEGKPHATYPGTSGRREFPDQLHPPTRCSRAPRPRRPIP